MPVPTGIDLQETRSDTLLRHIQAYLRETGVTVWSFSQAVVDAYHARTAASHREVSFRVPMSGEDAHKVMKTNHTHITRLLTGDQHVPVDLEESLVLALPEDRQRACWVDLAARVGRMSVAHPEDGFHGLTADLATFVTDFGELTRSFGPLLADGAISEHDRREDLQHAREGGRRLVSSVHTLIENISQALGRQERFTDPVQKVRQLQRRPRA